MVASPKEGRHVSVGGGHDDGYARAVGDVDWVGMAMRAFPTKFAMVER